MRTHTRRLAIGGLLVVATMLMAPDRAAAASAYRWTHDGNGQWTNAANWQHLTGPLNAGYPNAVDDVAIFDHPFSANRTVTLNQYVTLGVLAIYETHTKSFGLDPKATIFIDDAPVNVEGAKEFGWNAVLFSGADKLRSDLAAYGLKV